MSNLIFKPMIPITFMSVFSFIMLLIVLINRKHIINRILILALVLLISQRPMLVNQEDVTYSLNLDVIFVIDTTVSMLADDVKADTRIDLAKDICKKIVNLYTGSRFAIISHNNSAFVKYPFTFDSAAILSALDSIKIVEPQYAEGSSLSLPADYLKMLLNSSILTTNKDLLNRQKIVFILGDGELSNSEKIRTDLTRYDGMDKIINNGAIIGLGKVEGGKLRAVGSFNNRKYAENGYIISDVNQKPIISKLDENNLKELSSKLGLEYINAESTRLNSKIEEISKIAEQKESGQKIKKESDIYYYFSLILMILLIYELYYYRRNEL